MKPSGLVLLKFLSNLIKMSIIPLKMGLVPCRTSSHPPHGALRAKHRHLRGGHSSFPPPHAPNFFILHPKFQEDALRESRAPERCPRHPPGGDPEEMG